MKPHYTVPGPAIEGPAKPGTPEHGVPIRLKLTGEIEGKNYVNYHPFSKDGPVRPPTAQPLDSDEDRAPAAQPPGGAGKDKDGDDSSIAS
eukprot:2658682-Pyramimonas_sp.AAC.1